MFDRLGKKLRALDDRQFIAIGLGAALALTTLVLFGLYPLAVTLLYPVNQAVGALVAIAVLAGGGVLVGQLLVWLWRQFQVKKSEEAMVRIYAMYEDLRKDG